MRFRYAALDGAGALLDGSLEAPDEPEALLALRRRGLFPTQLRVEVERAALAPRGSWRPLTSGDLSLFLSQLALMLRSGLTLLGGLATLAETASQPALRECARRLSAAVQAGRPLSDALDEERHFPAIVARLVATAEATGELDEACERAADLIERRAELRRRLIASLTYPAIVVLAAAVVFVFLTTQVVPKFATLLSQRGVALPWTTQALMDLSAFLVAHGPALLGGSAALALGLFVAWRTRPGRRVLERIGFAIPVLGAVLQAVAMVHLTRTLALLLRSGLPLLESLRVLAPTAPFLRFSDLLERAREQVVRGAPLARALSDPLFPAIGLQVVGVGEETGALEEVVTSLGAFYERRLERLLQTLASLIEPALLIVIGGMVGFVYLSFFQAVFRVAAR